MIQVQLKLRLTKAQDRTLERWLWHLTAVWNWAVKTIEREGPRLSLYTLFARLAGHGSRIGISGRAVLGTAQTAHVAWRRAYRGQAGRPRLKGLRRPLTSIAFDCWKTKPRGRRITVPILGAVRFHPQDIPDGHVGAARLVKRASGWYLCLFVHAEPAPIQVTGDGEVGIDPGFSSLVTLSTGERIEHPHELQAAADRLGQAQRGNQKQLAARIQERIANRRKNRNHHLSRRLVAENRLIVVSADQHCAVARRFGKSVTSAGHFQLRSMLAYKCSRTGGREYIEVSNRHSTAL
jgi:putative transposase